MLKGVPAAGQTRTFFGNADTEWPVGTTMSSLEPES